MKPLLLAAALALLLAAAPAGATGETVLRLASTTSTVDTGLFDVLLPPFKAVSGIRVDVISVGTGKALKLAENGDVDLVLVHSRTREDAFLAAGFGIEPVDVMHNDFVLVGPEGDPAGVKGAKAAPAAFAAVAMQGATFVSRGDSSGTHDRELELWAQAGVAVGPKSAFRLETGQGMGATLRIADTKGAYCLADRATFLALAAELDLKILFEGGEELLNRYRAILVNPAKHPNVNVEGARRFSAYLVSPEGQAIIGAFKKNGRALFHPAAGR